MSPSGRAIWSVVGRAVRRVRAEGALAVALAVAAVVPALLLVAWAAGGGLPRGAPMTLWVLALAAAAGLLVVLGGRWVRSVDEAAVATAAERARALPEGSLRGVLELGRGLPVGVSGALFRRTESELAARVAGATPAELAGDLGRTARTRWSRLAAGLGGLVLLAGAVGFAAPDRARSAWTPLLHPVEHLRGPVYPALVVLPGDTAVDRGEALDVMVEARLRQRVELHWRSMGDLPRERTLVVEAGRAAGSIGPVASAVSYWVEAPDGAVSDTFTAVPRDPLMLSDLVVDVTYPPHVGLEPDHYRGDPPVLRVPEGTRLRVTGRTTRTLVAGGLRHESGTRRPATVTGSGFHLDWTLGAVSSGRWEWALEAEDGTLAVLAAPLEIQVMEDAPPRVRIAVPGADTLMPASHRQPILAEADDDHGLAAGGLVFRRVAAAGERGQPVMVPLPLDGTAGRATLQGVLDASDQPLVAGDVIEYHVAVRDNSPAGQTARSRTYLLRLPDMAELRDRARGEADEVLRETERLAERARELEAGTRDLSRASGRRGEAQRSGSGSGEGSPGERELGYEEASEAAELAADHEEVLARVADLEAGMAELERALEEAGLQDPELQSRLDELRALQEQLASAELRDQVQALREAAEALDPEAVRSALEQLASEQERFREQIEQTLRTMQRAVAEQEMSALAREADEIAGRQEALAEAMRDEADSDPGAEGSPEPDDPGEPADPGDPSEAGDPNEAGDPKTGDPSEAGEQSSSPDRAGQQEELSERAERLGESLQSLQQQLMQVGESEASSQTGQAKEQGAAAQQSMEQAGQESRQQQGSRAAESAQRAAGQMSEAARTLDEARQQMADSRQSEAQRAVQQATREALGMAERQESLRQQMEREQRQGGASGESLQQLRSDQATLQQGLEQLGRTLSETGERSGRIDPGVAQSLERARQNMGRTAEGLEDGGRMPVSEAGRTVESLNELAMALLENEAGMQQAMGGGGVEEALRRLSEAAREQGALNDRSSAVDRMRLSDQARARQLQQLGQQQRGLSRQVGEVNDALGGREDVLGRLDQLSAEAEQLARELEGGRLDPEVMQRQERLFHRLLDAGRSLERDEYSDERLGRAPGDVGTASPGELGAEVLDPRLRYPAPTAEQLERLPPAYRRLILDYFDRLNRGGTDPDGGGDDPDGGGGS